MPSRDYRDILGGGVVLFAGAVLALYALNRYEMGTFRQLGPGMYPFWLGILMAGFGVIIAVPAFFKEGPAPHFRIFSPLFVLGGIAAFAFAIPRFGLLPAIVLLVLISTLAEKRFNPLSALALAAGLSALGYVVFSFLLGLPITLLRWPY